ncbi:MAG TPA: TRAP transporter substrate-binding protein DctP, partial [Desulfosarcina sp.]|nr:TRAP transporter substrate-binding protein DctP [Desulfosarcina sp.]
NSYEEIDYVKAKMFPLFAERFEKRGYVLLGFAEAGFVYLFSRQRIDTAERLRQTKMWVWKGDRVAESFLDAFGVQAYPLQLADVNIGLETGMIDSFYSPVLASVAFQWYAKVSYMLDYPMVNATGALLMSRRAFSDLAPQHQAIVSRLTRKYCAQLVRDTRRDSAEAMEVLAESGIERLLPGPEQVASFQQSAQKNYQLSVPSIYSRELFDHIQGLIAEYRQAQKGD